MIHFITFLQCQSLDAGVQPERPPGPL
jgi:hypothetical protein